MKKIIKIEEISILILSIYGLFLFDSPWWCYLLLVLGPDISMVGYLAGNSIGAILYNIFHHKAISVILFIIGFILSSLEMKITGIILFGHSSMDRAFGFGLKYKKGFNFTHLGNIKNSENN